MRVYSFILDQIPQDASSLVDIGCARGDVGFLVRTDIRFNLKRTVGIDAFPTYVKFCQDHKVYDEIYQIELKNVVQNKLPFKDSEFDVSVLSQIIEHLSPEDGSAILDELERITARRIIVVTDNFWTEGVHKETGNPYQEHRSRWSVKDFKERGYRVIGIGAFRYQFPSHSLSRVLQLGARRLPSLSRNILAVKDKHQN